MRDMIGDWLSGCRYLLTYDNLPGYRRLSWRDRKRVDIAATFTLLRSRTFLRGALCVAIAVAIAHILTWRYDMYGARRDLLRVAPILLSLPWLATARRKHVASTLRFRDLIHRHATRDVDNEFHEVDNDSTCNTDE
ncbi:MAG: hypothetical protein KJO76_00880 [Gammaproteobacteria bacterium]|nr:hypothetical protein [Gammaproteobacteria bacterium]